MQAIRHIFEHAPASIPIPEDWQQRRLEIILLVQEEEPKPVGLKKLLASMPDAGEDEDFSRFRDTGREVSAWDY